MVERRVPTDNYLYRKDDHEPLDAEGLAWLADQLCSTDRVHPDRTMASGWIMTQAAYEYPALFDAYTAAQAEIETLRARVAELEELVFLYVDPSDVRPEHESAVSRVALRKAQP